jgi:hypothetical protein
MRSLAISLALGALALTPAAAQKHPDFTGTWSSATSTPLERPAQFKNKTFFTPEEAATFEKQTAERAVEKPGDPNANTRNYNEVFYEHVAQLSKTRRTSIITDPPDGRLPALTPAAAALKRSHADALKHPMRVEDMGLQDRCMTFAMSVPPLLPYRYNSNYQMAQTGDWLVIEAEMPHDARAIPLDGRAHVPANVRSWLGDSVGHWEGDALVVDTTNFNDAGGFYGDAGGMYGWDRNLHVTERMSLLKKDKNTILYEFTVDDPTAFTKPWKGEYTFSRATGEIYEYACHEGNYALPSLLKILQAQPAGR